MAPRKIGYARISNELQSLEPQLRALRDAGFDEVFSDTGEGWPEPCPGLISALAQLREGDTFAILEGGRLARDEADLLDLVLDLIDRKIELQTLKCPEEAAVLKFKAAESTFTEG
ncbi:recombinase family protein [Caulobacter soli]|uniref:recombinase family protein n=1 Tax=Caulobacter soli TaxID=2708539 RepID=UPI0013ED8C67|nr:recombinase family protein [Caulobacter soli]